VTAPRSTQPWTDPEPDIAAFLDDYDQRGAASGGDPTALFAPQFLAVDPARALALTPEVLARALPARRQLFDAAGVGPIRRQAARQLRLDDRHVLISADWTAEREGGQPLQLASTFLVRREPEGPRILVYLNHKDIAALLGAPD
jgi:hypothetical protein